MKAFRAAILAATAVTMGMPSAAPAQERATATVRADTPGPTYDPRIFTQSASHLVHCIYQCPCSAPTSAHPNHTGSPQPSLRALHHDSRLAIPCTAGQLRDLH